VIGIVSQAFELIATLNVHVPELQLTSVPSTLPEKEFLTVNVVGVVHSVMPLTVMV
jgi:hypothetical protein